MLKNLFLLSLAFLMIASFAGRANAAMDYITTDSNGTQFYDQTTSTVFTPWGVSYMPFSGSIINNMQSESGTWTTGTSGGTQTQQDLQYYKSLANVVRVFIRFGDIMTIDGSGNPVTIVTTGSNGNGLTPVQSLTRLCNYCATLGVHMDITFIPANPDAPAAYASATEAQRWPDEAACWGQIASAVESATFPNVVFCYDLCNEPVATQTTQTSWVGSGGWPQYIDENPNGRTNDQIATAWASELTSSSATYKGIRYYDTTHMVTIGELAWWDPGTQFVGGFDPTSMKSYENFVSCHIYPGQTPTASSYPTDLTACLHSLGEFSVGQPIFMEETGDSFGDAPDVCSQFIEQASVANGGVAGGEAIWYWASSAFTTIAQNATALGPQPVPVGNAGVITISGATNAAPIVITTSTNHGLNTGQQVSISGALGNTAANGQWFIKVLSATTFSLNLSNGTGSGGYTGSGLVTVCPILGCMWELGLLQDPQDLGFEDAVQYYGSPALAITGASGASGQPITITASTNNGYGYGEQVTVAGLPSGDCSIANGTWDAVSVPYVPTQFTLGGSNGNGTSYTTADGGSPTATATQFGSTPHYSYNSGGSAWSFSAQSGTNGSGIAANGSSIMGSLTAPGGTQVAFIQGTGIVQQYFYLVHGTSYTVSCKAAETSGSSQTIDLGLSTGTFGIFTSQGSFNPTTGWATYSVGPFTIGTNPTGWYPVTFVGTGSGTAFIDSVAFTP